MAIKDLYDAIRPELESDCTVRFGTDALEVNDSPPKVTFVPGDFSFVVANRPASQGSRAVVPRSLATRRQEVQVHCWAQNAADPSVEAQYAEAEALVDRVLWAIERACGGRFDLGAGAPLEASEGATSGVVLAFSVFFHLPVVEASARRQLVAKTITDVSTGLNLPVSGTPPAVTGVAVFGDDEVEATPAP